MLSKSERVPKFGSTSSRGQSSSICQFKVPDNAQVLRADIAGDANTVYVYGHDAIAQAKGAAEPSYFLRDGHGSVRHLATSAVARANTPRARNIHRPLSE
jgi:hypothetical protein